MLLFVEVLENADDRELIENLYKKYKPWLVSRAHRIVDNIDTCDDLAHDCFVNMINHIDTLRNLTEAKQKAYLAVSIDHITLNYAKRASKISVMKNPDAADLEFLPDAGSVENYIEKKLDFEAILKNFPNIPKRDRDILIMKFSLELKNDEISKILGIKKSCVRMTIKRSIAKLQREIEERGGL